MNPAEALYRARELGAVFTVSDNDPDHIGVKVVAPLQLPGSLMADLKVHKAEIIVLLGQEPDYAGASCTCGVSTGATGSKRCGVCALPLICPHCSGCRGCRRALRDGLIHHSHGDHRRERWQRCESHGYARPGSPDSAAGNHSAADSEAHAGAEV
jgi:hypothetical protein